MVNPALLVNQVNLLSASTWGAWNIQATTTATSTIVWGTWNVSYTVGTCAGATITGGNVYAWPAWNDAYAVRVAADVAAGRRADPEVVREQLRRADERHALRVATADAARRRARDLLDRSLSPEQREDLAKKDCFYLDSIAPTGERRRYRIDRGTHGNVKLLDEAGSILGSYCVQPDGVPTEDAMLAQKLWIETNEKAFLKVANFTPRRAA